MLRYVLFMFVSTAVPLHAGVFSSEFSSFPVDEGWELIQQWCSPETWVAGGWYWQALDFEGCPPPYGDEDDYTRSIEEFNGAMAFFLEFRVQTNGDRSGIPYGSPGGLAMGNFFGVDYTAFISADQIKLFRDVDVPILFIDVEPGMPHTIRVELDNHKPGTYTWYIDGEVVDQGVPKGPFPAYNSMISWVGRASYLPCENRWHYIRFGDLPVDASGDFDSDEDVDLHDFYFVHECLSNGGPNADAGPGCRFADMDSDTDVDLADFAEFQVMFAGH
ncbi:MAG: hypothetical protein KJ749_14350 [Planctomycetes bacterium]|nr:hypothetical protein [Planctomycetota bacterium]